MSFRTEEERVGLAVHHAYTNAKKRIEETKGEDRLALQREYREWFNAVNTDDDAEIDWCSDYQEW